MFIVEESRILCLRLSVFDFSSIVAQGQVHENEKFRIPSRQFTITAAAANSAGGVSRAVDILAKACGTRNGVPAGVTWQSCE